MREYILTQRERNLIQKYLSGARPDTYRQLKTIATRAQATLTEDMELVTQFLQATRALSRS